MTPTTAGALYVCEVRRYDGQLVLNITGARDTVIEAALRVMLDNCYPVGDHRRGWTPHFTLNISEVAK